jgi:vacuolar-type H+-ATPase catalytic subunit A/Vma1
MAYIKERTRCRKVIEDILSQEKNLDEIVKTIGQFKITKRQKILFEISKNNKYGKGIRKQARKMKME